MVRSTTCGKDRTNYPNGQWPSSALCPLYTAPDENLRRAAALAFDAMSSAYQSQTGSALCVTEGYRSLADQIAIKAATPNLAATPGTSKHELGLAVDLCGGVQSFTDPAHVWMKQNGPSPAGPTRSGPSHQGSFPNPGTGSSPAKCRETPRPGWSIDSRRTEASQRLTSPKSRQGLTSQSVGRQDNFTLP
jgi:D-alanyl-D-alanine carboxypeptidase